MSKEVDIKNRYFGTLGAYHNSETKQKKLEFLADSLEEELEKKQKLSFLLEELEKKEDVKEYLDVVERAHEYYFYAPSIRSKILAYSMIKSKAFELRNSNSLKHYLEYQKALKTSNKVIQFIHKSFQKMRGEYRPIYLAEKVDKDEHGYIGTIYTHDVFSKESILLMPKEDVKEFRATISFEDAKKETKLNRILNVYEYQKDKGLSNSYGQAFFEFYEKGSKLRFDVTPELWLNKDSETNEFEDNLDGYIKVLKEIKRKK